MLLIKEVKGKMLFVVKEVSGKRLIVVENVVRHEHIKVVPGV